MSKIDPYNRIDLTGPWAGFGFQAGHMFTPEGHQLEPCDMAKARYVLGRIKDFVALYDNSLRQMPRDQGNCGLQ